MRTKSLLLACVTAVFILSTPTLSQAALAAKWGYVVMSTDGENNLYFDTDSNSSNPNFYLNSPGANPVLTIEHGGLLLLGGEAATNPDYWTTGGAEWMKFHYKVDGGQFMTMDLTRSLIANENDYWRVFPENMVAIGAGLAPGRHTLSVYFSAFNQEGQEYAYIGSAASPYMASIDVAPVPEPSNIALCIFGGLVVISRAWKRLRSRGSN